MSIFVKFVLVNDKNMNFKNISYVLLAKQEEVLKLFKK